MNIEKDVNEIAKTFHNLMKSKGFWDEESAIQHKIIMNEVKGLKPDEVAFILNAFISQKLALMASEISEALEGLRSKSGFYRPDLENLLTLPDDEFQDRFKNEVKDSMGDELADVIYRIFDFCGFHHIDIGRHIEAKHRYNATRPRKHGKSF